MNALNALIWEIMALAPLVSARLYSVAREVAKGELEELERLERLACLEIGAGWLIWLRASRGGRQAGGLELERLERLASRFSQGAMIRGWGAYYWGAGCNWGERLAPPLLAPSSPSSSSSAPSSSRGGGV